MNRKLLTVIGIVVICLIGTVVAQTGSITTSPLTKEQETHLLATLPTANARAWSYFIHNNVGVVMVNTNKLAVTPSASVEDMVKQVMADRSILKVITHGGNL